MSSFTKVTACVAAVLLCAGITALILAQCTFHRYGPKILASPTRLEDNSSFARSFSVSKSAPYYVGIWYPKKTQIQRDLSIPADDFSAEFSISVDGKEIYRGDNSSWLRPAILGKDQTTRLLGPFDIQARKKYDLSFRFTRVGPTLASTTPVLMLVIDSLTAKGPTIAASFWSVVGFAFVVVGIFFSMPMCGFLIRPRSKWEPPDI